MPSNTAHIQQRAQLKQHDDLVIAADERNEWHDGQNEVGLPSTPGVHSRPAPVREYGVSTIHSHSQRSDKLKQRFRLACATVVNMSLPEKDAENVENKTSNPSEVYTLQAWHRGLLTDICLARASSKVIGLLRAGAKATKAAES